MNYHGITKSSLVDGEGVRTVLWVSGCNHFCDGCQNPYTWDVYGGKPFGRADIEQLLNYLKLPYIDGLTLSGGDPMHPANRSVVNDIARTVKLSTRKSIWMYTGYLYEQIKDEPVMMYIDVVVDGKYDKTLPPAKYRGSENQRIIYLRKE